MQPIPAEQNFFQFINAHQPLLGACVPHLRLSWDLRLPHPLPLRRLPASMLAILQATLL